METKVKVSSRETTKKALFNFMKNCETKEEWNKKEAEAKKLFNGNLPSIWYEMFFILNWKQKILDGTLDTNNEIRNKSKKVNDELLEILESN